MANTNQEQIDKREIVPVVREIKDIGSLVYLYGILTMEERQNA